MGKGCEEYTECKRHRLYWQLFGLVLGLIVVVLLAVLIVWLVLRPTKPRFYLRDVSVSQFKLNQPNQLFVNLQVTISSQNPNERIGIYYDKLDAYVEYKDQQVTVPTGLPTGYQGHKDFVMWSPFLYGTGVPISSYLKDELGQDENAGFMLIHVKVDGRLRWKVGTWISGHYHIYVNCPAFLTVANGQFKFEYMTTCSVDV